jgi:hypothetical protein
MRQCNIRIWLSMKAKVVERDNIEMMKVDVSKDCTCLALPKEEGVL